MYVWTGWFVSIRMNHDHISSCLMEITMPVADNPGSHLLSFLRRILAAKAADNDKFRDVVAKVLEIDISDKTEQYKLMINLHKMVSHVEECSKRIPDLNEELYLRKVREFGAVLCQIGPGSPWAEFRKRVTPDMVLGIEFCSNMLGPHIAADVIHEEEIKKLRAKVERLISEILTSTLSDDLKRSLVDYLRRVWEALVYYALHGNRGLEEALESGMATICRKRDEYRENADAQGWLDKVVDVAGKINTLVQLWDSGVNFLQPVRNLLQLGFDASKTPSQAG